VELHRASKIKRAGKTRTVRVFKNHYFQDIKTLRNFITKNWRNIDVKKTDSFFPEMALVSIVGVLLLFLSFSSLAQSPDSLIKNGDFEEGRSFPVGWIVPKGESVRFILADPFHNRVLALNSLDSLSTQAVTYKSTPIEIASDREFLLEADIKTLGADLTIHVIGYGDVCGERRAVYKAIAFYGADRGDWRRIKRLFCPDCTNYKVKSLQILFSTSGAPGKIFIDNIRLFPVSLVAKGMG